MVICRGERLSTREEGFQVKGTSKVGRPKISLVVVKKDNSIEEVTESMILDNDIMKKIDYMCPTPYYFVENPSLKVLWLLFVLYVSNRLLSVGIKVEFTWV